MYFCLKFNKSRNKTCCQSFMKRLIDIYTNLVLYKVCLTNKFVVNLNEKINVLKLIEMYQQTSGMKSYCWVINKNEVNSRKAKN